MPSLGVFLPFRDILTHYYGHGIKTPFVITSFCFHFPYMFSMILNAIIAIDRLLIITWQNCYKDIISDFRLKLKVTVLVAFSIGYCCLDTYYSLPGRCCDILKIFTLGVGGIMTMSIIAVILAYMRILFFVRKCSKTMMACKHSNSKSDRRLSKTIFHILAWQITCTVPYLTLLIVYLCNCTLEYEILEPWPVILRKCQRFCNAIILLRNQKRNARKHKIFSLEKINRKKIL